MIINSKLEINHDILKNISSKNWSNHTLYTFYCSYVCLTKQNESYLSRLKQRNSK